MPLMNIFRGLPGSGKTTLANKTGTLVISPADMYSVRDGKYDWNLEYQEKGFEWANEIIEICVLHEVDISVASVLPKIEHVLEISKYATDHGYKLNVVDCIIDKELSLKRNIHDVPIEHIKGMASVWENWEDNVKILPFSY